MKDSRKTKAQLIEELVVLREQLAASEGESKYRDLFEGSRDAVYIRDRDGRLVEANPAALELMGYTREKFLGLDVRVMYANPDDVDEFERMVEERGHVKDYELQLRTKSGRVMDCLVTSTARRSADGTIIGYQGIVRDITEQKRAAAASREQGRELAKRVRELNCLYGISELLSRGGTTTDEVLQGVADLIVDALQHPGIACARVVIEGRTFQTKRFHETARMLSENVTVYGKWVGSLAVAYLEERPAPDGRIFLSEEEALLRSAAARLGRMIERVRTEKEVRRHRDRLEELVDQRTKALRESEERLRKLIHKIGAGVVVHGADTRILQSNAVAQELLSLTEGTMLGKPSADSAWRFLRADGTPMPEEEYPVCQVLSTGHPLRDFLLGIVRPDSENVTWVLIHAVPDLDPDGGILQVIVTFMDVSERRQLEERLFQAQKLESMGTLASGVAHNFNNLLCAIMGNMELAKLKLPDVSEAARFVENAARGCEQAAQLTQQLLSLARGRSEDRTCIRVSDLVDGVLQVMTVMLDSHIQTRCRMPEGSPYILANYVEIEQVLMNLCLNAQDAMPKGGLLSIEVDVLDRSTRADSTAEDLAPGEYVQILVRDSGTGIEPETLGRIFDPFFTTREPGKGIGLGLSVAYRTVVSHGGRIDVESEVGKGTTFRIYLPTVDAPEEEAPPDEPINLTQGSETVLVVDDEDTVLQMARNSLELLGYTAMTATNGQEAIAMYEKNRERIDLVVLDYMMPEMDGEDAYRELRKIDPDVRVLVASGYDDQSKVKPLLDAGVDGFIQKPFRLPDLSKAVRDVLDKD